MKIRLAMNCGYVGTDYEKKWKLTMIPQKKNLKQWQ